MALNAGSHNIAGEETGPVTGQPPPLSNETKSEILHSSTQDATGQNAPGRDGGDANAEKKVKSAKELEKERKKAEKDAKFREKQKKQQEQATASSKAKKKSDTKKEALPEYVEETPKGQKKILKPLDDEWHKAYHPKVVESAWYDWWEAEGFFKPQFTPEGDVKPAGHFVIPIPPPNVTGALHCGHALATALQDTLIRWHRMKGFTVLYLPGCDHAGISTQSVVEKMLWRREKKTRHDLGRQEFTKVVWDWKDEYHQKLVAVLKRLGGSMDWSREAFTMDANLSKAVTETFVRLHEEGYIYRSNRLVSWCTQLNTALSNIEVQNKEITGRTKISVPGYDKMIEFGVLTYFKYPIEGEEAITVATTRPETMLGDSGIAVHPDDERYKHLIGKKAKHPFVDRELPIVADTYVEKDFGTGAVKLTPAHDQNDFELGKRHNLAFINILNDDGTLNQNGGKFAGQKRFDVRYTVVKELTDLGLFVKQEDNPMKIPLCEKSKDVIEPLIKPQWWMKMGELAEEAVKVVKAGEIKIRPQKSEDEYYRWMSKVNDWCLSRQLWWGHQAPAYFVKIDGHDLQKDNADGEYWVTGRTEEDAQQKATKKFPGQKFSLERDPDVLDTWFSSGLWPFSTLGWPDKTHDFEKLFPTSVLETGWDILFFWVVRMIFLSLKLTGKVPFSEVYCHSLIRDSDGRKMSKSLGNVIDPIDILEGITLPDLHAKLHVGNLDPKEVKNAERYQKAAFPQGMPECGADALRFSLIQYTTGGGDIAFDIKVMHAHRRFCNKVYQATKYVLGSLGAGYQPQKSSALSGNESMGEKWILHKLSIASKDIDKALTNREFSRATIIAHKYFYDNLCDIFIEISKPALKEGSSEEQASTKATLYTALEGGLTMLHPFIPFVTEELWQRLPRRPDDSTPSICLAAYPQYVSEFDDSVSEARFQLALDVKLGITNLINDFKPENAKILIQAFDQDSEQILAAGLSEIKRLSQYLKTSSIEILPSSQPMPKGYGVTVVSPTVAVYAEIQDLDIESQVKNATEAMSKATDGVKEQRKVLDEPEFAEKSSKDAQILEQKKYDDFLAEQKTWEHIIEQFHTMKL
ncbi:valyl-tRNA synthetase [Pseudovirgaria hyperparasitica]|uniref:Valine--tRNA ligase, mitochondrial n=1 Tax=Pseudovirgaria hyperparasitica TaxID=470096 RepID=A0A6A6VVX8_9PEZI|nr:valyl-tRNA synthetase [Pseudovirgaria hyperparasitica]KAF2754315.1 valyl-tRNA synthetase [Pseudovirgaria hyperparasitica]